MQPKSDIVLANLKEWLESQMEMHDGLANHPRLQEDDNAIVSHRVQYACIDNILKKISRLEQ